MRNPIHGLGSWFGRHWLWFAVPVAVVVVLAFVIAFLIDEPLRRMTERQMNSKMKGYTAHIRKLDFHPIGFSIDFYDVQFSQNANPDPPVMRIERLSASVQWRALIHRALVADFALVKPIMYVDKSHFETELNDPTPVKEHGWQDAAKADFLLEPYAGVKGHLEIRDVPLDYFAPVAARANVTLKRGAVSGRGDVEYSPKIATLWVERFQVDGLVADYHYMKVDAGAQAEVVKAGAQKAQQVSNARDVVLHVEDLRVVNANIGFINKNTNPEYRVFIDEMNLAMKKFSNQKDEGYGHATLTGRFLGSGATVVDATFRPENKGPDFSLNAKIENTDMRKMNDLLRAHAKFDVVSGVFSVFSELRVHENRIDGYVKPLFRDLKVYGKDKDEDRTFGQKVKEKAIDVAAKVLKNRPRKEVATVVDISGPIDSPQTKTWPALVRLIQNAFIKAILPGFQREASRAERD